MRTFGKLPGTTSLLPVNRFLSNKGIVRAINFAEVTLATQKRKISV
jgi:hypothetical protein